MNMLIVLCAKYLFVASVAIYLAYAAHLWQKTPEKLKKFIFLSLGSFGLAYLVAKITGHFFYNPRPFVVDHLAPLIAHAANNGFPSDHMLLTMAIASVVYLYSKKWGIVLVLVAVVVGAARVLARVHHVEDIVGSAVIALFSTYLVNAVAKRFS